VFAALAAVASAAILVQGSFVNACLGHHETGLRRVLCRHLLVAESWLNAGASRSNRGTLLAMYMLVLYIGLDPPVFTSPGEPQHLDAFHAESRSLISLAMVPIVCPRTTHLRHTFRSRFAIGTYIRISPLWAWWRHGLGDDLLDDLLHGAGVCPTECLGTSGVARIMAVSMLAALLTRIRWVRLFDRNGTGEQSRNRLRIATFSAGSMRGVPPYAHPFSWRSSVFSGFRVDAVFLAVSHVNDKLERTMVAPAAHCCPERHGAAIGPILVGSLIAAFWAAVVL